MFPSWPHKSLRQFCLKLLQLANCSTHGGDTWCPCVLHRFHDDHNNICDRLRENDPYGANELNIFCALDRKSHKCSIVCRLFQGCSPFRCEVMSTNASAILTVSKVELTVSYFNLRIIVTSPCYNITRARAYFRWKFRENHRWKVRENQYLIRTVQFILTVFCMCCFWVS